MPLDPIKAAIAYANDDDHAGAGFTLGLHFAGGQMVEVDVYGSADDYSLMRRAPDMAGDRNPIFPNLAAVAFVEVLW